MATYVGGLWQPMMVAYGTYDSGISATNDGSLEPPLMVTHKTYDGSLW